MILLAIVLVPAMAAGVAYALRRTAWRSVVLVSTAALHAGLVGVLWMRPVAPEAQGWLAADALGRIVISVVSVLFLCTSHYAVGYLRVLRRQGVPAGRAFASCLLAFLAATSLVCLAHHLALLWMGMGATTLSVAPLILDPRDRRSLEAVWKYLVLSSVGIAMALLGVFLFATAQSSGSGGGRPLLLEDMIASARLLDPRWLRAAFVFTAIGFGTKMGLAPMHAWKPDTYGEAPGLVAGLMAGALTTCAFLGLARAASICFAAGLDDFVRPVLMAFGLASLVIAAAFVVRQRDLRRLLAYSSIEHMGLLVLALGLGGIGAYGAVLHAINNGLAKGCLFLVAGNIALAQGSASARHSTGLLRSLPVSGVLLVAGLFAISGSPPFGLFISEFTILAAAFRAHHVWLVVVLVVLLAVIFVGIAAMVLDMAYRPREQSVTASAANEAATHDQESRWLLLAPLVLAGLVLMLGVYIPSPLADALARAASALGGHAP